MELSYEERRKFSFRKIPEAIELALAKQVRFSIERRELVYSLGRS